MECLVFARQLGRHLPGQLSELSQVPVPEAERPPLALQSSGPTAEPARLEQQRQLLRQLCWQVAGVERRNAPLAQALQRVRQQRQALEGWPQLQQLQQLQPGECLQLASGDQPQLRAQVDLQHRLVLAELLIEAALFRGESRGGHYRTDAPAAQPFWQRHTLQQRGQAISTAAIG
jgi:L-aspartate oxidase